MTALPVEPDPRVEHAKQRAHSRDGIQSYIDQFAGAKSSLPGAHLDWLAAQRSAAMDSFAKYGWPTTKREDWKFTNLKPVFERTLNAAGTQDLDPLAGEAGWLQVHFANGYAQEFSLATLPKGVWIGTLGQAVHERGEWLRNYFNKLADNQAHPLRALNTALWRDGLVLHLEAGAVLDKPLHVVWQNAQASEQTIFPRLLVVLENNAQATLVEHYVGDAAGLTNSVGEVFLAENAHFSHYKLQEEPPQSSHVGAFVFQQAKNSVLKSYSLALGAGLGRTEMDVHLAAPGAEAELYGVYWGRGEQLIDHTTVVRHDVPHCRSRQVYRGVLDERSRGVFNGKVMVARGAQVTDSSQSNKNLLLSKHAIVHTRPQLEVHADDVKCAHGAAVGQLDEAAMFYLRQRGIPKKQAQSLLTSAFVGEVLEAIELLPLRERLQQDVLNAQEQQER